MDLWDRVRAQIRTQNTTQEWVANTIGVSLRTFQGWITKDIMPNADQVLGIAKALGSSVEFLLTGEDRAELRSSPSALRDIIRNGLPKDLGGDGGILVPLLSQKVSAGAGQELADYEEILGSVPIPSMIGRRYTGYKIGAMEVRGDSMTRVFINDGDLVYFAVGLVRDDGIYVIDIHGERLVKRLQFDYFEKKISVHSENDRYPQIKTLPMDSDGFTIVGKVVFTLHVHPY